MIVNLSGGFRGFTLNVKSPPGSSVTISKEGKSKTATANDEGMAVFQGLDEGVWSVSSSDGEQTVHSSANITKSFAIEIRFNTIPKFSYTGKYEIVSDSGDAIDESNDNWKIRFLTSGTLTFSDLNGAKDGIDVFCVGGGGGGGNGLQIGSSSGNYAGSGGGGGGGGYAATGKCIQISAGESYKIVIGAGGESCSAGKKSSAFGITASGGSPGESGGYSGDYTICGGDGGNGGGSTWFGGGTGGSGEDGGSGNLEATEFEEGVILYAGGGGAGFGRHPYTGPLYGQEGSGGEGGGGHGSSGDSEANTGGGGGGGSFENEGVYYGGSGGSGIVVIRNARGA